MRNEIPKTINNANVVFYSLIDERHKVTGACKHEVTGSTLSNAIWAAICQYDNDSNYYLFICYESEEISDTCHETIEEAKEQAEFEYENISSTWQEKT